MPQRSLIKQFSSLLFFHLFFFFNLMFALLLYSSLLLPHYPAKNIKFKTPPQRDTMIAFQEVPRTFHPRTELVLASV